MAVLINDLEVEIQNPTESDPESSQPAANAGQRVMAPSEISMILAQQIERLERVRSH